MKWLQWSSYNLASGIGGVEVHARSLARELRKLGVEAEISADPRALEAPGWDVIHTHGSSILPRGHRKRAGTKYVHTLHGTTIGRMAACGEWAWPGGYLAAGRELEAVTRSDVILAIHEHLWLYGVAKKLGKKTAVCGNGWDSAEAPARLPDALAGELPQKFWVYIGRGSDPVKGADRVKMLLPLVPDLQFVAVPGEGFEDARVIRSGPLTPAETRAVLDRSAGLILTSRYEGMPLVVLEALGAGVPVVATNVGGIRHLAPGLQGIVRSDSGDPRSLADALRGASRLDPAASSRQARATVNQTLLSSWRQVAERALEATG